MRVLAILLCFLVISCALPYKDFNNVDPDIIIKLSDPDNTTSTVSSTLANGYDVIKLKVTIDKRIDKTSDIILRTTIGKFTESATNTLTTKPKTNGELIVTLLAPTTPGIGYVTAEIKGYKATREIQFIELDAARIIGITAPASSEANGYASIPISITVPAPLAQNQLTVTTTSGLFEANNSASYSAKPDANGKLDLSLKSPEKSGTGYISAEIGGLKTTKTILFTEADPAKSLTVSTVSALTNVEADGVNSTTITVKVLGNTDLSRNNITLRTSAGTFIETGTTNFAAKPNSNGILAVQLKAPRDPSTALVTVETTPPTSRTTISINFTRADADNIVVDPGTFTIKASTNEQVLITAQLLRNLGKGLPSPGAVVEFDAFDAIDGVTRLGQFRAKTLSDATGKATALFTVGNTSIRREVIIVVTSGTATGQARLLIVN